MSDLAARALSWRDHDPDPETRAELGALLEAGTAAAEAELAERFAGPLEFGTAGLRGILGAGESRMNRAVIRRTCHGLGRYLCEHVRDGKGRGVAIGYDGRRLSRELAEEAARVLLALGVRVHLSATLCPTPLVAFAVRALGAAAGAVVTASHNPPEYNGFKVYAENGAQIVPPADGLIAAAIAGAPPADEVPLADLAAAEAEGRCARFSLDQPYLDTIGALVPRGGDRSLAIAYTPLHGVGWPLCARALALAGFDHVEVVPEQAEPDGRFPTVRFPNPEEPGALDLAFALARRIDAPLVLANDPDADRLAAAVRTPAGTYRQLTGNELGVLLGHDLLTRVAPDGDRLVMTTIVSSPLLGTIARALGVRYEETLTGFKWIANRAMELEARTGTRFVFGYEEALGYTVGTAVRDKDGIGAALALASLAAELHARGESLLDELERIARRYGLFASRQKSLVFPGSKGKETMAALLERLRDKPPESLGGTAVTALSDVHRGVRLELASRHEQRLELPPSNVLSLELAGGHRVIARPSGTEPKLKIYFDVREPLGAGEPLATGGQRAAARIDALEREVLSLLSAG